MTVAPWVIVIVIQIIGIIFTAGIAWDKLSGIERRLDRIENWINSSRNTHGEQLER